MNPVEVAALVVSCVLMTVLILALSGLDRWLPWRGRDEDDDDMRDVDESLDRLEAAVDEWNASRRAACTQLDALIKRIRTGCYSSEELIDTALELRHRLTVGSGQ